MHTSPTSLYTRLLWALLPLLLVLGACGDTEQEKYQKQLDKRIEEQKVTDDATIQKYLQDNNITNYTRTPSGLYIVYRNPKVTTGNSPKVGETVEVKYTGRFITSGLRFDSSIDRGVCGCSQFRVGQVIAGWNEALSEHMRVTDKVLLLVPSHLAYGANGSQPNIPPFTPLMFDIELLRII